MTIRHRQSYFISAIYLNYYLYVLFMLFDAPLRFLKGLSKVGLLQYCSNFVLKQVLSFARMLIINKVSNVENFTSSENSLILASRAGCLTLCEALTAVRHFDHF